MKNKTTRHRYGIPPRIMELLWLERLRQISLNEGDQFKTRHDVAAPESDPDRNLRILVEEVGEIARGMDRLKITGQAGSPVEFFKLHRKRRTELRDEIVQAAAVCVAWLESIEATEPRRKSQ